MFKKYLISFLIIALCLTCLAPFALAQDQTVVIIPASDLSGVILILNPDGSVRERIYLNTNNYSIPIENNKNDSNTEEIINDDNSAPEPETPQEVTNDLAKEIFELVNKERVAVGLKELEYNFELQAAANLRAKEASESFSHTRPNGETCYTAFNVNYNVAGENLIVADQEIADAANLVKTWMESEGHRANILLPEFTSIAIGVYQKDNSIFASQLFIG